jgi:uncharacterized protein (DUF1330 family)
MTRNARKNILLILLLIVVLTASFGYYLFNKGPLDVKNSVGIETSATALYEQFNSDTASASKKYAGKIVAVTGEVNTVSVNQQKEKIILLKTNTVGASINCTMEEDPGNINVNSKITIKGICSGLGQADEELGLKADLYLTRCFLIK